MAAKKPSPKKKAIKTRANVGSKYLNIRIEPGLRGSIAQIADSLAFDSISDYLLSLAFADLTGNKPSAKLRTEWIDKEKRSANLNLCIPGAIETAVRHRATARKQTLTDYLRSLAITHVNARKAKVFDDETNQEIWVDAIGGVADADPPDLTGSSAYRITEIVKLIHEAMEQEGLSLAAYQKVAVYRDLEKKFGNRFTNAVRLEGVKEWTICREFLQPMIGHEDVRPKSRKTRGAAR